MNSKNETTQSADFNSRAHVERDVEVTIFDGDTYNFNSRAHVERDYCYTNYRYRHRHFNSRAHVERDYDAVV